MTRVTAPQIQSKTASEVRNVAIDFRGKLDTGELLTGSPTVTDPTSALTIASAAVNTTGLTINGSTVQAGEAVQFRVSGGAAGSKYTLSVTCGTNSTPAQTLQGYIKLAVVSD